MSAEPARTRADRMKVGDCFVGAADGRAYKITGWLKDRAGGCPKVVDLVTNETDFFSGCATPYGPFAAGEALEFSRTVDLGGAQ